MSGSLRLFAELLGATWRRQPRLATVFLTTQVLDIVAFAAIALALRTAIDAAARGLVTAAAIGAVGAAVAYATSWLFGSLGMTLRLQLVERVGLTMLESDIVGMIAHIDGIDHLERTDFLDRVTVLRGAAWGLMDSAWGAVQTTLGLVRLGVTLLLLSTVDPGLLGLLVFAAVPLWFDQRANRPIKDAETGTAEAMRLQRHLFELSTSASAGKEIRVAGAAEELSRRQWDAWDGAIRKRFHARLAGAWWRVAGWALFTAGFSAGLALVISEAAAGRTTAGDVVLTITVATNLRAAVQQTVGQAAAVAGASRLIEPFRWLRRYWATESARPGGDVPAPLKLYRGISFEDVTYTYPGADRPAISDFSVHLPAGRVVAVVGEYGSGKTTLVKLLCKFHLLDSGTITVDDTDLQRLDTAGWRRRTSIAFQDFGRYQGTVAEAVGLGEPDHLDDRGRISNALAEADAERIVDRFPAGLDTQLGREFGGVDLSEGQWQKIALARACMRPDPVLFVLDEPTASLDAPSEHTIFTHYMQRARQLAATTNGITLIISHRFSTVADADLILVMEKGRLVETGSHHDLLAAGGLYAELYSIQADAYARGPTT